MWDLILASRGWAWKIGCTYWMSNVRNKGLRVVVSEATLSTKQRGILRYRQITSMHQENQPTRSIGMLFLRWKMGSLLVTWQEKYLSYARCGGRITCAVAGRRHSKRSSSRRLKILHYMKWNDYKKPNSVCEDTCYNFWSDELISGLKHAGTWSDRVLLELGREGSSDRLKYCSIDVFIQCLHQRVFVTLQTVL